MTNGRLDILFNNSGGAYSMPLSDVSLDAGRELFELNVWSVLAVTQAFLPLLLKSQHGAMIANHTSIDSVAPVAMTGIYNASKAATVILLDNLRIELEPFNVKVFDLKNGAAKSGFYVNMNGGVKPRLPEGSIYGVAREAVEMTLTGEKLGEDVVEADEWANTGCGSIVGCVAAGEGLERREFRAYLVCEAILPLHILGWPDVEDGVARCCKETSCFCLMFARDGASLPCSEGEELRLE